MSLILDVNATSRFLEMVPAIRPVILCPANMMAVTATMCPLEIRKCVMSSVIISKLSITELRLQEMIPLIS